MPKVEPHHTAPAVTSSLTSRAGRRVPLDKGEGFVKAHFIGAVREHRVIGQRG